MAFNDSALGFSLYTISVLGSTVAEIAFSIVVPACNKSEISEHSLIRVVFIFFIYMKFLSTRKYSSLTRCEIVGFEPLPSD